METGLMWKQLLPSACISLHPWQQRHVTASLSFHSSLHSHRRLAATKALASPPRHNVVSSATKQSTTKRRRVRKKPSANSKKVVSIDKVKEEGEEEEEEKNKGSVGALQENGDPLGRKQVGKSVVRWIRQGMRAMACDLAEAEEEEGEFMEMRQRMGPGLTFVIQAQPYLNAVPMPIGLEAVCFKAYTHYPTLFDHFQRELRDVLQEKQAKGLVSHWQDTQSWKLFKDLANSAQHRAVARKTSQRKPVQGVLGMDLEKANAIQGRIDDFTKKMSELLRIERDAELEFTQEELNAVPTPDENADSSRPIEFLVSHGQAQQELCDTICNLYAVSTSTGYIRF